MRGMCIGMALLLGFLGDRGTVLRFAVFFFLFFFFSPLWAVRAFFFSIFALGTGQRFPDGNFII